MEAEVVDATDALLEDLRGHDGRADAQDHATIELLHRAAEQRKVHARRAPDDAAVEPRMVRDDVVADARVDGEGDFVARGLREHAAVAVRVRDDVLAGLEAEALDGLEQVGARGGERVAWLGLNLLRQLGLGGDERAVLVDELAERLAVAEAAHGPGQQREVDEAPRFVPGAEVAGGDVVADALGGAAQPGKFPVVNRPGPVGREVRKEAAVEHLAEEELPAVLHEVRAVDEHHGCVAFERGLDVLRATLDERGVEVADGRGRGGRLDEHLVHGAHALALREREDADFGEVEGDGRLHRSSES